MFTISLYSSPETNKFHVFKRSNDEIKDECKKILCGILSFFTVFQKVCRESVTYIRNRPYIVAKKICPEMEMTQYSQKRTSYGEIKVNPIF